MWTIFGVIGAKSDLYIKWWGRVHSPLPRWPQIKPSYSGIWPMLLRVVVFFMQKGHKNILTSPFKSFPFFEHPLLFDFWGEQYLNSFQITKFWHNIKRMSTFDFYIHIFLKTDEQNIQSYGQGVNVVPIDLCTVYPPKNKIVGWIKELVVQAKSICFNLSCQDWADWCAGHIWFNMLMTPFPKIGLRPGDWHVWFGFISDSPTQDISDFEICSLFLFPCRILQTH